MEGKSPEEAKFFWTGGPIEVAERTWFQSSFSGTTAFETDQGLLLVDTGMSILAPTLAGMLRQRTKAPVHTAIYTHGHVDHAYGLGAFLVEGQAKPRVIGHRAMPGRFGRYERTPGHNAAINARQFGGTVEHARRRSLQTFRRPDVPPDTFYEERLTIEVGGLRFELHHCRGETDDHTWVYNPERGVLCPGDLFIWGVPNAGNPQKAQRYPWDWAAGLREMAACEPRSLCPGHGGPVVNDPERIQRMLLETASYLESIVEQTIAALEAGSPPHVDIVRSIEIPRSDSPWLQPVYDDAEFIVRNVIRYYGGWWSGRPSELKPAPRAAVAREIASLAGGAVALAERAREIAASGDPALACHLADYALEAKPEDARVGEIVAALYEERSASEPALMTQNLFRSAAAYARSRRPFA
ncbi:MAG: MBL fold metallo-hydrolase [Deltaproteobacteria bacterium]|nr:MBL fold metallo-hydrolase [Deltaproteobacteria bacterium]